MISVTLVFMDISMSMDIVLSAILTKRILLLNADTKIPAEEKINLNRSVSEAEKVEVGEGVALEQFE